MATIGLPRRFWLILLPILVLVACAGPLTRPPGVVGCAVHFKPADGGRIEALERAFMRRVSLTQTGTPTQINLLVLSGGGKYGAYGAGVLEGWSRAERDGTLGAGAMKRADIDIVTGISTGALLATYAAVGNAETNLTARASVDRSMRAAYEVNDADIRKERGILQSLRSNGLSDIRGKLEARVRRMIDENWERLRAIPADRAVLVGMVNLTDGRFYVADLLEIARSGSPIAKDCYEEAVLASAAVPLEFAPRFIDGHGYVDGGTRFGLFLGSHFKDSAARAVPAAAPGGAISPLKVNFRAIVNGNLSPNDPADNPARAAACDSSTLSDASEKCAPVGNNLLSIVRRSAADILVDQVYRDSVMRLDSDLAQNGIRGTAGYLYVSNQRIADEDKVQLCHRATKTNFDRQFMDCLAGLGVRDGTQQNWMSLDTLPRAGKAQ